jgi:hypothetical protein
LHDQLGDAFAHGTRAQDGDEIKGVLLLSHGE